MAYVWKVEQGGVGERKSYSVLKIWKGTIRKMIIMEFEDGGGYNIMSMFVISSNKKVSMQTGSVLLLLLLLPLMRNCDGICVCVWAEANDWIIRLSSDFEMKFLFLFSWELLLFPV